MNGITPDYKIINKTSGKDLTATLRPFIIALSVSESADNQNDTLSIRMNGEGIQQFPASGTHLEIMLGYKETELVSFGTYKVDTKTLSGMPLVLAIKAGASDFTAPIKNQKTRVFDNKPIEDILQTIAQENQLELRLSSTYQGMAVDYLKQEQESDMNLITSLAKEHGANGTVKNGKLLFMEKAQPAKIQTIQPTDLKDFRMNWTDKPVYNRVVATWHDRAANTAHEEIWDGKAFITDKTGNIAQVQGQFNSQTEARKKAKAKWNTLREMQLKASISLFGNPHIVSKIGLKLQGFIPEVQDTILFIKSTRHEIKNSYTTYIELENQSTNASTG